MFFCRKDKLSFRFGKIAEALFFDHLIQRNCMDARIKEYVFPMALERVKVSGKYHKTAGDGPAVISKPPG